MKKFTLLSAFIFFISAFQVQAQQDQRTIGTRVADVLAQLPAQNETDLNHAMKEMEALGKQGLLQLSRQMTPGGETDNSKLEYAIMGYTAYVSAPGRTSLRKIAEAAWINALQEAKDKNLASFFMSMMEIIGSDNSVKALAPYLNDKVLNHKAAPVLAALGSPAAGKALLDALSNSDIEQKAPILLAIGNMRYAPALEQIQSYAVKSTDAQKEAALYALVEIADPSSQKLLLEQTRINGKVFEDRTATAHYGTFINRLTENGHPEEAKNYAASFVKNAENSNVFARTLALNSLVYALHDNAISVLAKAAFDDDIVYRNIALKLAAPYVNNSNLPLFIKNLKKASPDVQMSLIYFLGNEGINEAYKPIFKIARSTKNQPLRHEAVLAMAKIGHPDVSDDLIHMLNKGDELDADNIRDALLLVKDPNLTPVILTTAGKSSGYRLAALVDVLAAKKVNESFALVASLLHNKDPKVQQAALKAIVEVADAGSLAQLFSMLPASDNKEETAALQNSIIKAIEQLDNKESRVLAEFNKMPSDKQYLLYPVLSSLGTTPVLDIIYTGYKNGTGDVAQYAFKTLSTWPNTNAMDVLYAIATDEEGDAHHKEDALRGYISLIQQVKVSDAQHLILLKKAMAAATTHEQQSTILDHTAQINTFPALAFAAEYLNNSSLSQKAAGAVMNIGLSNKDFYGTLVRSWLTRAMNAMDGQDAVYMKKSIQKFLDDMPQKEGYVSLFNGKNLEGWKGLVANPVKRAGMGEEQFQEAQDEANEIMRAGWKVQDGTLVFLGKGDNIVTEKKYGDIEMFIDWKIYDDGHKNGDAGIYLRGTPQVQIWDTSRTNVGAQVGSGGLYNNKKHESKPLTAADNPLGQWNHFYIMMIGDKVTVYLNGELVTDNIPLENYWDRDMPLWAVEQIELQAHGSRVAYRDIYIHEINVEKPFELSKEEKDEGFKILFDGTDLDQWTGNLTDYVIEGDELVVRPRPGSRGNLYTKNEYGNFIFRFEFKLTRGANNGLGIRAPLEGDAAYTGIELQILDNTADIYKDLKPWQYHGSVYGTIAAKRGFLKPVGEWNYEEVIVNGATIKVILNGATIVAGDVTDARKNGTIDGKDHPGIFNKRGHIGFLGHGSVVHFRNIRIKEL